MYECESWTIKKAEHWRINAFDQWCWRRLPKSPLDFKEIKPVNRKGLIFIGRTDAEAEAPILWPPNAKNWLIGKDPDARVFWLKAGGQGDNRGWDSWMASSTQWTGVWASSGSWWWTGKPGTQQSMGLQRFRHDWMTGLNWTDSHTKIITISFVTCKCLLLVEKFSLTLKLQDFFFFFAGVLWNCFFGRWGGCFVLYWAFKSWGIYFNFFLFWFLKAKILCI